MDENFHITQDHDEIKTWIEEHGGKPAMTEQQDSGRSVIDILFGEETPECREISWEEFFDTFDALNMEFRYESLDEEHKKSTYGFINRQENPVDEDSDQEMPEDDVPVENIVPSAPVDRLS